MKNVPKNEIKKYYQVPAQSQIDAWKKEHEEIGKMIVSFKDPQKEPVEVYFKVSYVGKLFVMDLAYTTLRKTQSLMDFQRVILENIILNEDKDELLANADIFLALSLQVDKIVSTATAEIAKV